MSVQFAAERVSSFGGIRTHTALKPLLPVLLLGARIGTEVAKTLRTLLDLIAGRTYRHRENRSKPRTPGRKPHKNMTQKNC